MSTPYKKMRKDRIKLTEAQQKRLAEMWKAGNTKIEIRSRFGVGDGTINAILDDRGIPR